MKKYRNLFAFLIAGAIMILLFPTEGRFTYKYQKGHPWIYDNLIAQIDFPIFKTEDEIFKEKEEMGSQVVECYTCNEHTGRENISDFNQKALDASIDRDFVNAASGLLTRFYESGIVAGDSGHLDENSIILIKRGKRMTETPAQSVYDIEECKSIIASDLGFRFRDRDVDSLVAACNIAAYLVPNLTYDPSLTNLLHEEAIDHISPTKGMIYDGQMIVAKGELVTAEIAQLIDSYKREFEKSFGTGTGPRNIFSHIMLVVVMLVMLLLTIMFADRAILSSFPKVVFLLSIALLTFFCIVSLHRLDSYILLAFPFAVMALYIGAFFPYRVAAPAYIAALLPLLVIPGDGTRLFFINALAGFLVLLSHTKFNRGMGQFINALVVFFSGIFVFVAFHLLYSGESWTINRTALIALLVNGLCTVIFYPFVSLLERIFSFTSPSRLWELTDTNTTLLRELSHQAPGTFQHSMQVANLAESAAREIGADALLSRAGALYHDIGKMNNPLCFIENKAGGASFDYHASLTPEQSAADIIRHVGDGLEMARKYSLPPAITAFISSHHGTTITRYFYSKYCNEGGDSANIAPFRYNGTLPSSKEQAIVMIADSVEAAARTIKEYTPESVSALVESIVKGKMEEGQFADTDITLREIETVKGSLKNYLLQIYHGRIAYPHAKEQGQEEGAEGPQEP